MDPKFCISFIFQKYKQKRERERERDGVYLNEESEVKGKCGRLQRRAAE